MATAMLLTASDFAPLRESPGPMAGALRAVEEAIRAHRSGAIRQGRLVDRRPGEFEGIRVSLLAGDGLPSGMRVFGNPPHTRAFLLFDGETRALKALLDYSILNSLRVGATAGVAAKYLSPPNARVVGLLGSGWQATPQVYALQHALPALERVRVYSPTSAHREAFAADLAERTGLQVEPVDSAREALRDAPVVDLCAPGHFDVREPLFEPDWIAPGALVISMAGNQYPAAFRADARLVADIVEFTADQAATPLGAIIADGSLPREAATDRVIYQLEGGTVQDLFIATWGYEWAIARGCGTSFDLST
jgi:ornithine cyclodeaminase/alanine dehydrogenase-like protein (mu-crystallin family)